MQGSLRTSQANSTVSPPWLQYSLPKKRLIDFYGLKDLQHIIWRYQRRENEKVHERDIYIVLSQAARILFLDNVELLSKGISLGVIA